MLLAGKTFSRFGQQNMVDLTLNNTKNTKLKPPIQYYTCFVLKFVTRLRYLQDFTTLFI